MPQNNRELVTLNRALSAADTHGIVHQIKSFTGYFSRRASSPSEHVVYVVEMSHDGGTTVIFDPPIHLNFSKKAIVSTQEFNRPVDQETLTKIRTCGRSSQHVRANA